MAVRSLLLAGAATSLALGASGAFAQTAGTASPAYDPLKTFAPLTLPDPVSRYRGADGAPGPDYWQNRADYVLHAAIDTGSKTLTGSETITYTNNSPQRLDSLWIQLDQNIYRKDSRSTYAIGRFGKGQTEGFVLDAVEIEAGAGKSAYNIKADYVVSDTRMQVRLPAPLKASGGKLKLHVRYHYTVPGLFGGRTAWGTVKDGEIYDIAQWYPRMQVYDDHRGWDTLPYLGNEFYLEYGTFDYDVTVPADMVVAGSGALTNPKEVLNPTEQARFAKARSSDATVTIRSPDDVATTLAHPASGTKTWRFHMDHTRDVAFSASKTFVWDAARINLPEGKSSLAMSFYPRESVGADRWGRSTEYMKDAVERFSKRWYPYEWPAAINIAGPATGMEYPGIVFDGVEDKGKVLFWISAHEIGHSWFPMIVGFDERRNAWMDEGFNTFIDVYESGDFNHGEYAPKRDGEYAPKGGNPVDEILPTLSDPEAPVILNRADAIREKYRHPVTYFKSALGLVLLREQILGPERFDGTFRKFIKDWAYKHPSPSDFFRAMESEGGEDLSWWWRGWYFNNWTFDMAAKGVSYLENDPKKGAKVTVANLGQLILPATVRIEFADATTRDVKLPAETWIQKGVEVINLDSTQPVKSVTVDPDHVLPDSDRTNNGWKP